MRSKMVNRQQLNEIALKNKPKEQELALEATEPEGEESGEKENSESQ